MAPEYQPLFNPGLHDINYSDFDKLFIAPFSSSPQRVKVGERFKVFISKLSEIGISLEVWVDGSFSTSKPDPADVDVAIFYNPNEVNALPSDKIELLKFLVGNNGETKARFKCDVY